jgi:hypothetical protein
MAATKRYLRLAGVVFRDEAEALERRLLGELSTEPHTNLSAPEAASEDGTAPSEAESVTADAL